MGRLARLPTTPAPFAPADEPPLRTRKLSHDEAAAAAKVVEVAASAMARVEFEAGMRRLKRHNLD
jgi:hypothetical protein